MCSRKLVSLSMAVIVLCISSGIFAGDKTDLIALF